MATNTDPGRLVDWRLILEKYINIVGREEGVDFLYPEEWAEGEWTALRTLAVCNPPNRVDPLPEWSSP